MNPNSVSLSLIAGNAALIVASTTPSGAGALTLVSPTGIVSQQPTALGQSQVGGLPSQVTTGIGGGQSVTTNTITLDVARRVLVTYGSEGSNRTIQIVGGDRSGRPITETLTVTSGATGTVYTQQDFLTITGVNVYAAWTAAMTVGTNNIGSTPWIVVQRNVTPFNLGLALFTTGTVTAQVDATIDDPNALPTGLIVPGSYTAMSTISSTTNGQITTPIVAYRLTITAGQGTVRMASLQAGNWN